MAVALVPSNSSVRPAYPSRATPCTGLRTSHAAAAAAAPPRLLLSAHGPWRSKPMTQFRASSGDGATRAFALLPYTIPLLEGTRFSNRWFSSWTAFEDLARPLQPLQEVYWSSPFFSLVVWMAVWLAVVRNSDIDGYIRFNAAQALILAVFLQLPYWIERIASVSLSSDLFAVVYAFGFVALLYCMVRALLGKDTNLPLLGSWAAKL